MHKPLCYYYIRQVYMPKKLYTYYVQIFAKTLIVHCTQQEHFHFIYSKGQKLMQCNIIIP